MTKQNEQTNETPRPRAKLYRHRLVTAAGVIALAGLAFGAGRATAHGGMGWHSGYGHGGERGGRMLHRVDRALDSVGATSEQKQKIRVQLEAALPELRAMRERSQQLRTDLMQALRADQPDRAALEKLRADRITQMDLASRRMTDAILSASETLTPQQRQDLLNRIQRRWRDRS